LFLTLLGCFELSLSNLSWCTDLGLLTASVIALFASGLLSEETLFVDYFFLLLSDSFFFSSASFKMSFPNCFCLTLHSLSLSSGFLDPHACFLSSSLTFSSGTLSFFLVLSVVSINVYRLPISSIFRLLSILLCRFSWSTFFSSTNCCLNFLAPCFTNLSNKPLTFKELSI
jgi:hypothetical protein